MEQLEQQIIADILAGKTERFDYIVRTYGQRVFALIVRIVPCKEDAEELTQDVMVKVFSNLGSFRRGSSLSTWIYRIAYTTAISRTRRSSAREINMDEQMLRNVSDQAVDSELDTPSDGNPEREQALIDAIGKLSAEERALITLHYFDNLPLNEVADIMSYTLSNVKVKLMRTRRKLYLLITNGK